MFVRYFFVFTKHVELVHIIGFSCNKGCEITLKKRVDMLYITFSEFLLFKNCRKIVCEYRSKLHCGL